MHDTITFAHGLASFDVTIDPALVLSSTGERLTLTRGVVSGEPPRVCPHCGGPIAFNQVEFPNWG
ncbi:hypothetical protein [uncultured Sphaerochaeta sp.]|uniref:hypothetical protein n=1 Tax=uncultured Sphaerochaeta sp. TaxID=886478 RepID=UPI002A0A32B4|nr:hypothetical protein [uncultured Sphaerochaeta sp.]